MVPMPFFFCLPKAARASRAQEKGDHNMGAHVGLLAMVSPNQVLTHAARVAAKHLQSGCKAPLVAARCAREGLWLE